MATTATATLNKPAWVELSSPDAAASRDFYARLFGWDIEVSPDPQYGGYGMSDLVASGAANNVYVTLARPSDPNESADLATLADRITAARGLFADIELAPDTITVRITRHERESSPSNG